ncbi:ferritin [uncultured Clostridium sp.]|jgi:ferritin|uniref:ferritin n=1 Tax=uncultured Clostridium sp. TaxID=59620 RepID=UPI002609B260|nr:ferritin [uncultured Clostridium sp.]
MLSKKLLDALTEQVNFEFYSSYTYLAMSAYAESIDFMGVANYFRVQAKEELDHAMKFYGYLFQKGGFVELGKIDAPTIKYDNVKSLFDAAYHHEQLVTEKIYHLADIATEEREHATLSLLQWFIDEQVEEENNFITILKKVKRFEDNLTGMYMLDDELATRVYVPIPTQA